MKRQLLKGALLFGIWTLFAVFEATPAYLILHTSGQDVPLWEVLSLALTQVYVYALLAVPVLWLSRLFPLERGRWGVSLLAHGLVAGAFAALHTAVALPLNDLIRRQLPLIRENPELLRAFVIANFHAGLVMYAIILGIGHALGYYKRARERDLRASQLEAQLAQAQLQMLKMQLHPHFLFNTLNAIAALMHQDVELADRMIARLGELLRSTLENAGTQEVSLRQELDFIKPYLEIEQARFGARLTVELNVAPDVMDARVPNLLLQPLVENAIRHGIAPRSDPGRIEITARRDGPMLALAVRDDGPGLNGAKGNGKKGIGLQNTRARLQQLYGSDHSFEVRNAKGRGLVACVAIPYHPCVPEPSTENEAHDSHANSPRG